VDNGPDLPNGRLQARKLRVGKQVLKHRTSDIQVSPPMTNCLISACVVPWPDDWRCCLFTAAGTIRACDIYVMGLMPRICPIYAAKRLRNPLEKHALSNGQSPPSVDIVRPGPT